MYGIKEGTMWNEPYRGKGIAMKEPCRVLSKKNHVGYPCKERTPMGTVEVATARQIYGSRHLQR